MGKRKKLTTGSEIKKQTSSEAGAAAEDEAGTEFSSIPLPSELLTENIFLYLLPSDLLHLALACSIHYTLVVSHLFSHNGRQRKELASLRAHLMSRCSIRGLNQTLIMRRGGVSSTIPEFLRSLYHTFLLPGQSWPHKTFVFKMMLYFGNIPMQCKTNLIAGRKFEVTHYDNEQLEALQMWGVDALEEHDGLVVVALIRELSNSAHLSLQSKYHAERCRIISGLLPVASRRLAEKDLCILVRKEVESVTGFLCTLRTNDRNIVFVCRLLTVFTDVDIPDTVMQRFLNRLILAFAQNPDYFLLPICKMLLTVGSINIL